MALSFKKICRLCMIESNDNLIPIFQESGVFQKIEALVPNLELSAGDGLPGQICSRCLILINISYNFKLQCETSDSTLRLLHRFGHNGFESNFEESKENTEIGTNLETEIKQESDVYIDDHTIQDGSENRLGVIDSFHQIKYTVDLQPDLMKNTFSSQNTRKKVHINKPRKKKHVCDICGKAFVGKSHLATHKFTHTGEKPLACNICGKKFASASTLKVHTKIHTGEKPFECNHCGIRFSQSCSLISHTRLHTGDRPYACVQCDKRFFRSTHLQRHRILHTGEKPFVCSICGQGFPRKDTMIKHIKVHEDFPANSVE